jgi:hypothetical protein
LFRRKSEVNSYIFFLDGVRIAISPQGILANLVLCFLLAEIYFWWRRTERSHLLSFLCTPLYQLAIIAHECGHAAMDVALYRHLPKGFRFIFTGGYTEFVPELNDMSPVAAVLSSLAGPAASFLLSYLAKVLSEKVENIVAKNMMKFCAFLNLSLGLLSLHPVFGDGRNAIIDSLRGFLSVRDTLSIVDRVGFIATWATILLVLPLWIAYLVKRRPEAKT